MQQNLKIGGTIYAGETEELLRIHAENTPSTVENIQTKTVKDLMSEYDTLEFRDKVNKKLELIKSLRKNKPIRQEKIEPVKKILNDLVPAIYELMDKSLHQDVTKERNELFSNLYLYLGIKGDLPKIRNPFSKHERIEDMATTILGNRIIMHQLDEQ